MLSLRTLFRLPLGVKFIFISFLSLLILSFWDLRSPPYFFIGNFIILGWKANVINSLFLLVEIVWLFGLIKLKKFAWPLGIFIALISLSAVFIEIILASEKRYYKILEIIQKPITPIPADMPLVAILKGLLLFALILYLWMIIYLYRRKHIFRN